MSGRAQNAVASLGVLPPEILLPIVTSLPGLDTLWSLMTASPNVWRLFNNYAHTITEGILSGPNSILYGKIRELVRGVILVRAKTLPFKDLNEFRNRFLRGVNPLTVHYGAEYIYLGPEILSAAIVPTEVFRSVVATACQISALSQGCLASYLAPFRDIRPLHTSDSRPYSHDHDHDHDPDSCRTPAWELEIVGKPHKVVDAGQPSWREEMRALRAMWIIQLVGEMKGLVKEGWSEEDIDTLKQMDAADLVERPDNRVIKAEEVGCAMDYLRTLRDAIQNDYYRLPMPPLVTKSNRWITAEQKAAGFIMTVVEYCQNGKFFKVQKGEPIPEDSEPAKVPFPDEGMEWMKEEAPLNKVSCGMTIWRALSRDRYSPVKGVKFDSFRRLGFAFWDKARLHLAGLTNGISKPFYPDQFYFFALESILPADEVANIKAELRLPDLIPLPPAPPLPASSASLAAQRSTLSLSSVPLPVHTPDSPPAPPS
ncbi:uncharacterized protein FIESC28_03981 [Fusarium coffeatum]|uniref:F-box domain-containing protein n=1 Tax=Fusarium coffeatum TaxID=231269 RepID=A0A366S1N9_9HYPO|nr:uncharacterized protein FIESC28_03981 [Fusarium coffeatum]RBR23239.1 hypothetical protein FIESC28_03981 [Fusarium coffeatum]